MTSPSALAPAYFFANYFRLVVGQEIEFRRQQAQAPDRPATCQWEGCSSPARPKLRRGPRSKFCDVHRATKQRLAKKNPKTRRIPLADRPACCRDAGSVCEQHRDHRRKQREISESEHLKRMGRSGLFLVDLLSSGAGFGIRKS
jgi:hypothetical protein